MAKKKKLTPEQAAAARYDDTPESRKRAKNKERARLMRKSAQAAQRQANKSAGFRMIMPLLVVAVIVVSALALTIGPGLFVGS